MSSPSEPRSGLQATAESKAGSRRMALLMSWRELRRHPWRTLLIVLLIGFPVFGMTFGSVLTATSELPTDEEKIDQTLWGFDGVVQTGDSYFDEEMLQDPTMLYNGIPLTYIEDYGLTEEAARVYLEGPNLEERGYPQTEGQPPLPDGVDAYPVHQGWTSIRLDNGASTSLEVVIADFDDDNITGDHRRFALMDGQLSAEAFSTPGLNEFIDEATQRAIDRGEPAPDPNRITLEDANGGTHEVVLNSTMKDRSASYSNFWTTLTWHEPGQGPALMVSSTSELGQQLMAEMEQTDWYLNGPVPTEYQSYAAYNQAGYWAVFRPVAMDPPAEVAEMFTQLYYSPNAVTQLSPTLLIGALALAETALLAGAAFAVGSRQQRRTTALLSVSGAEPYTVQQTMTFSGLWTGLIAAIGGMVLGVILGVSWIVIAHARGIETFALTIPWGIILGAAALAFVAAVLAAWLPARATARMDAWAAIKGGVSERRPVNRQVFTAGIVLTLLGLGGVLGLTVWGMSIPTVGQLNKWLGIFGPGMLVVAGALGLGMLLLVPGLVQLLTRNTTWLPFTLRMAARDADRNRGRTVPVTISILGAAALGSMIMVFSASFFGGFYSQSPLQQGPEAPTIAMSWVPDPQELDSLRKDAEEEGYRFDERSYFTGTPQEAVDRINTVARTETGATIQNHWRLGTPYGDCELDGRIDCKEFIPMYSTDSQCLIPVPEHRMLEDREKALWEAEDDRHRAVAVACQDISIYGFTSMPASSVIVADPSRPDTVPEVLWSYDDATTQEFLRGKAVVFDQEYFDTTGETPVLRMGEFSHDPRTVPGLELGDYLDWVAHGGDDVEEYLNSYGVSPLIGRNLLWEPETAVELPAVYHQAIQGVTQVAVIPLTALEDTAQTVRYNEIMMQFDRPTEQIDLELLDEELGDTLGIYSLHHSGTDEPIRWAVTGLTALLIITVAGITTGLALADSRRDQAILSSIGARPTTRKSMAAAQTLLSAALGVVLGVVLGALPVLSLGWISAYSIAWIPWPQLVAMLIGIPLVAALITWLVVPKRLPLRIAQGS